MLKNSVSIITALGSRIIPIWFFKLPKSTPFFPPIVCEDLTENGIRKALNFGHTLGHGIESYFLENENKTSLLHGEAIAAGMILESYISKEKGWLTNEEYHEIKYIINDIFERIEFNENDINQIIELLIYDKKNEFGKVQFALLEGIGKIKINQEADNELIFKAFEDYAI